VDHVKPGLRAVIYLRISLDRTGEEAGVTRQREDCERRCRDRGWQVVEVLSDNDVSAAGERKRPGFERLLSLLAEGQADVVVVWHLDRLQRSRKDEVRLYELCRSHDITVSIVRGPDLEWRTPTGRYLADNLGSLARMEIEIKSDRHKRANRQAALAGKRRSGRRPFGYEKDGKTIRETEAAALRGAYASFLAGVPLAAICRTLNDGGHLTPQAGATIVHKGVERVVSGRWTPGTLAYVLSNPRNAGLRGYAPLPGVGEPPLKGRPKIEVVGKAEWPGVVDEATWQAAVAVLRNPARKQVKPRAGKALLTSVARCGRCAAETGEDVRVWSGWATTTHGSYRVYKCSKHPHLTRKQDVIDEWIGDLMIARLSRTDAATLTQRQASTPDVDALRVQAQALRTSLDELAGLLGRRVLTVAGVEAESARLHTELAEVEGQLADAGRVDVLGPLVGAADVAAAWGGLSTDRQRVVVDLLAEVTLLRPKLGNGPFDPASVSVVWRTE
jgi:site-specific DNA recombinase